MILNLRILFVLFGLIFCGPCTGCGARTSIPEAEKKTVHVITTELDQKSAFYAVEEAMADAWNSWQDVNQLRQPETGTLVIKGLFSYTDMMAPNKAEVAIRVKCADKNVTITYTIGRNNDEWKAYPSANAVKDMRVQFYKLSKSVSDAVHGIISTEID